MVAVQAADYFAQGAVAILSKLGVDNLIFGTEEMLDYNAIGDSYIAHKEEMAAYLESLPEALSYPQRRKLCGRSSQAVLFLEQRPIIS